MGLMNKRYTWAWILWLLAFGVIEWRAILEGDKGSTLTHHVRNLIGEKGAADFGNWIFRLGLGALFVWLIPHFYQGLL